MTSSGSGGSGNSGANGGSALRADNLSRIGKKPAKREIVKFFKKHFSKSVIDERDGRDTGSGD